MTLLSTSVIKAQRRLTWFSLLVTTAPWWSSHGENRNHFWRKQPPSSQLTWTHWQHQSFGFRVSGHPSICRQETLGGQTSKTHFFLMHDRPLCFTWPWKKDREKKPQKEMDQKGRKAHIVQGLWTQTQLYIMFVDLCDLKTFTALLTMAFIIMITFAFYHLCTKL